MCLILFAHHCRADLPLLLLANRDESLERASAPAARWVETPEVVGGRDLVAGGSWLAMAADGRWAAVTNVREGERSPPGGPSRGWLVRDYLQAGETPGDFISGRLRHNSTFAGFNLLLGTADEIWYVSNRETQAARLAPGLYGLSNGRLDTPWPKVVRGKAALAGLLETPHPEFEQGFRLLADRETFPDHHLPDTGIPLEWERALSAIFIVASDRAYGTRSSTVLMRGAKGKMLLIERSFSGSPRRWSQRGCPLATVVAGRCVLP